MTMPLLIGGATTSRQHTAVKIAPEYSQARSCTCSTRRASWTSCRACSASGARRSTQANRDGPGGDARAVRGAARQAAAVVRAGARRTGCRPTGTSSSSRRRRSSGRRDLDDVPLEELVPYIDWTFFFSAWELKGRFPAILDHPQYGAAARELYDHAQALLERIIDEKLLTARGVYGFWPAEYRGRRHRRLQGRRAAAMSWRGSRCCGSRRRSRTSGRTGRWPTSSRRARAACRTTSARSPSRRASAPTSSRSASSASTTTTTRSS